jgi:hypothetical protein
MDYNTEAFLKYSSKPKWRHRLHAVALMYVWFCGLGFSASSDIHAYVVILCALFNGCMIFLVFEMESRGETVKAINDEAVRLKGELDWVTAKYLALEKEQQASPLT